MMQIPSRLISLASKALSESMDADSMVHVAKELVYNYDLYQRTGFRESLVIPQRDAARQIVRDMAEMGMFYPLVCILIQVHTTGFKGRIYPIAYLNEIIAQIKESGYIYDPENKIFVEDPGVRRSFNWGALVGGRGYHLAFLRIDIVENSGLVRKYPEKTIRAAYSAVRKIVENSIEKRNGRIWNWEGDGGLIAFYFANKCLLATLAGMEIINELFLYNALANRLNEPLKVRMAIHSGFCHYSENMVEMMNSDIVKETVRIESKYTRPDSMTISNAVCSKLDPSLLENFEAVPVDGRNNYSNYSIRLEH